MFSYEALRSRLESGRFQNLNVVNLMTPIIRIQPLSKSEIIVLLEKISKIHADIYAYDFSISEEELIDFIEMIYNDPEVIYITPRSIIRDYINVLDILYQNPSKNLKDIMNEYEYSSDQEIEPDEIGEEE